MEETGVWDHGSWRWGFNDCNYLELVCKRCKSFFVYNLQESGLKEGTVAVTNKRFTDWTIGRWAWTHHGQWIFPLERGKPWHMDITLCFWIWKESKETYGREHRRGKNRKMRERIIRTEELEIFHPRRQGIAVKRGYNAVAERRTR